MVDLEREFQSPSSGFRGVPFWAWNGKLEKDTLQEQVSVFQKMGFGGFHIHVRTGLDDQYLGTEYMEAVSTVVEKAKRVKPSARGELEITDLNKMYLEEDLLDVELLGRGFAWLDTGTVSSLLDAGLFVKQIESIQGIIVSSPEEIAYNNGWISDEQLQNAIEKYGKSPYGAHLKKVLNKEKF